MTVSVNYDGRRMEYFYLSLSFENPKYSLKSSLLLRILQLSLAQKAFKGYVSVF